MSTDAVPTNPAPSWTDDTIMVTGVRFKTASATRTTMPLIAVSRSVQVRNGALLCEQDRRELGDAGNHPEEGLTVKSIVRVVMAEIHQDRPGRWRPTVEPAGRRINLTRGRS